MRSERGFTLLEVMIAMGIMAVAFASILSVVSESENKAIKARQRNVVAMLAKNVMIETEYKLEGKTFDEVKKEDGGQFKDPFQDYRWKTVIKEIKFPSLNFGAGGGGGSGDSKGDSGTNSAVELLGKLITNYLSKAVREVTVTISWQTGSATQEFSLATYWVDLNHEFQLSE
jgi:type II secretion system protein I